MTRRNVMNKNEGRCNQIKYYINIEEENIKYSSIVWKNTGI